MFTTKKKNPDSFIVFLQFPGLYHKYRSLARANSVLVYPAGQRREEYKAWVKEVEDDCVRLKFSRR